MGLSRRALLLTAGAAKLAHAAEQPEPSRMPPVSAIVMPLASAPAVLIPGVSTEPGARLLGGKIYRGLMQWGADRSLQPDMARMVESAADGLSHVFHLRAGVTWHDGGGFDAADVVFSLARFHRALQPLLGLDRMRVEAADALTVVVTLAAPDPAFLRRLDALSLPIVPLHVHDRPGWGTDPRVVSPVGTGPFRLAEWLRLVRFEWFAGPKPVLAAIDCPIIADPVARTALVATGAAVLLAGDAVERSALPRLRTDPALVVGSDDSPGSTAMAGLRLNLAATPLDRAEVRLALACAIDRREALRVAWNGLGRVATGPLAAGSDGRDEAVALPEYDLRTAARHLTASGLRPDESGIRARLRYLQPPAAPWQALFPVLRAAFGRIGIELAAEPVSAADWSRRVASGDYAVTGFTADQTGDPALDLAPYLAALPGMEPTLADGMADAQALLVAQMPAIWLVEPAIPIVRDKRLRLPEGVLGSFADATLG